ncbi:RNA polymerase sigma factor [Prolixibacter sp. SD074]|uniref:RNA polymerase sigma factor n=1 Tax=Prolixibacter sp. SD074 TaxID=2652391 RepID=UPI00128676C5|nr:RNA polymerase sigma-70 factor [Prolixibacter sp. SD074]GET28048.1 DNA-directed RNA polymerase sigma-70 factor [Prolixibacter sp. SD074]
MDDIKLIKRFKAGEKIAINELYDRYSNKLYRFALGYLKSDAEARDIVQEVFVRLWNNRKDLEESTKFEAFLFTVTKNIVVSTFRKKIIEKEYLDHLKYLVIDNHSDTETQVDYALLSEKVSSLITQLPAQQKKVYILSKEKGYTNKAIAEELDISIKTVERHITKARRFLKENLGNYGIIALLFYELFIR